MRMNKKLLNGAKNQDDSHIKFWESKKNTIDIDGFSKKVKKISVFDFLFCNSIR